MAKKRPKKSKNVKNCSFSPINQQVVIKNQPICWQSKNCDWEESKQAIEQVQEATTGHRTKQQLSNITDFEKCRLPKRLSPPYLFENKKLKIQHKVPNTFLTKSFFEFCLYVEKVNFESGPR